MASGSVYSVVGWLEVRIWAERPGWKGCIAIVGSRVN